MQKIPFCAFNLQVNKTQKGVLGLLFNKVNYIIHWYSMK